MKALVYYGPHDLRLEERPTPEPGPGEALLQVAACGICGTDLRIAAGSHRAYPPGTIRVPGHEMAGRIVALGPGTHLPAEAQLQTGTPTFIAPNVGCGRCAQCQAGRVNLCAQPEALGITRDGAFAEYVLLPRALVSQGNVLAAPEVRDFGALALVEPLACVLRGSRACAIAPGDLVVIYGAGPIGLLHLRVAQLRSPRAVVVCQPSGERQALARQWGADHVVDPFMDELPALIGELSAGQGADVIIVATPAPRAQEQALQLAAPGARINFFAGLPTDRSGITIDSNLIHYKELIVTGSTANTTEDCREALELVRTGAIETARLSGRRYSLAEGHAAMQAAAAREVLKAVLEP